MIHLPSLITDLALMLIIAGIVTLIFKVIRQPVVLGYIVAGFLVSPNFKLIPTVTNIDTIRIWGEIGVIFLLFGLGLEFSFKKLKEVGGLASITGLIEVPIMLGTGFLLGKLLGWNQVDSLFLGGVLSISSTMIIIRAFDELQVKRSNFATVVFGVLIIEDLAAILLLVLLSTIAVTRQFHGMQLLGESVKLVYFIGLWFIAGIFLVPSLLRSLKRHLNDEMLLIVSLGLCLGMVLFATHVGFSPALGAFVMGSILAETFVGQRIEHIIQPMKDFFGAIFFVAVGMLIDPSVLMNHWQVALLIASVFVVMKILSVTFGSLVSGQTLRNSVQTGFSLAQIGEFSFIIATLGMTLKVTSDFLYPLAVAVSVITTFTTPYLIRASGPFAQWLERVLPRGLVDSLQRYSSSTQTVAASNVARELVKREIMRLLLLSVVLIAITILNRNFTYRFLRDLALSRELAGSLAFFLCCFASAPFLWAIIRGGTSSAFTLPRLKDLITFLRYVFVLAIVVFQVLRFLPTLYALAFIVVATVLAVFLFPHHLAGVYHWFEKSFMTNLGAKDRDRPPISILLPWEAHLASYEISPEANFLGETLEALGIREKYGVSVVLIERGQKRIKAPSRSEKLFPHDRVSVIGTDEQLELFSTFLTEGSTSLGEGSATSNYGLKGHLLPAASRFIGKTIRESGIREATEGLVVGLERGPHRILNPDSRMHLREGDMLWIVGNKELMKTLE